MEPRIIASLIGSLAIAGALFAWASSMKGAAQRRLTAVLDALVRGPPASADDAFRAGASSGCRSSALSAPATLASPDETSASTTQPNRIVLGQRGSRKVPDE